jgi:glutamate racemase
LGCTHFPALAASIRAVLPSHVKIVDSAATTAAAVAQLLRGAPTRQGVALPGGIAVPAARGSVRWLATDGAARFARVGSTFLGETLRAEAVEIIDL